MTALLATAVGTAHVIGAIGPWRAAEAVSGWIMASVAQLIGLALLIGVPVHGLKPVPMLAAAVLVGAAEVVVVRTRPALLIRHRETVSGVLRAVRRCGSIWRNPAVVVLALLVLAVYGWRIALGSFVLPSEWDGMWYHLVGPAQWIQEGRIGHTPAAFWSDVYPQGQEVLGAWAGVFTHTLRWSWAAGLPFFLLGFTAAVGLAVRFGARRDHALLAGLGFLTIPAVIAQSSTSYVDVGAATTAAAAFQFVLALPNGRGAVEGRLNHLWLAGLALALGTSVKASNLLTMACVVAVGIGQVVVTFLADRRAAAATADGGSAVTLRHGVGRLVVLGTAMVLPSVLLSSYWYIRTWIKYDNPFYPFTMFGFTGKGTVQDLIMVNNTPGVIKSAGGVPAQLWESWTTPVANPFSYDQRLGGLGTGWLWVLLPGVLLGLVVFVVRRQWAPLLGLLLPMLVMAAASPGPWWARYTVYLPILGGVFLAVFLTWVTGTSERPAGAAGYARWAVAVAVGFALVGTTGNSMWRTSEPTFVQASDWHHYTVNEAVDLMRNTRTQQDTVWPWFTFPSARKLPKGSVIALSDTGPDIRLPLMGMKMERKLVQVQGDNDLKTFEASLHRAGAQYLALDPSGWRDKQLVDRVETAPTRFRLVSGNDPVRIYALDGR
ncbi:hypothetical protein ACFVXG_13150 [Kitasatospora sp. NPDC058162]|uniref:hypothetical protein n=1 Tax=Kitasatospora sp. NPDC058162 TaxID=3346362 RepID=UPI0036DB64F4